MKRNGPRMGIRTALALFAAASIVPQVGCRAPAPPNDPFLYRSTIPPPGTITAPAAGAQPYYTAPAGIAPAPVTAPPMISPGTPVSPAPAPLGPATPVTPAPAAPPSKYSPPGGFNYQSSLGAPTSPPSQMPASIAAPANRPTSDSAVAAAGNWQPANAANNVSPASISFTAGPRPEPSVVRIVEPPKTSAPATTPDSQPSGATTFTPVTSAGPSPSSSASDASAGSSIPLTPISSAPATSATSASSSTPSAGVVAQSADSSSVPDITDFPSASNGAPVARSTASATTAEKPISAAAESTAGAPVNIAAQQPGTSYGYDPDYKTLRGQLEYSANSHRWKLNYLPAEGPIDEFGGSVVLPDASQLAGFEGGDFVSVTGTFSAPTAAAGLPMFSIQRIRRQ